MTATRSPSCAITWPVSKFPTWEILCDPVNSQPECVPRAAFTSLLLFRYELILLTCERLSEHLNGQPPRPPPNLSANPALAGFHTSGCAEVRSAAVPCGGAYSKQVDSTGGREATFIPEDGIWSERACRRRVTSSKIQRIRVTFGLKEAKAVRLDN